MIYEAKQPTVVVVFGDPIGVRRGLVTVFPLRSLARGSYRKDGDDSS